MDDARKARATAMIVGTLESAPRFAGLAARLEQEPRTAFRLVDPDFDQAGGRDVAMLVAEAVRFSQARGELLVVSAQFGQHVQRLDVLGIVVQYALRARDVADRA